MSRALPACCLSLFLLASCTQRDEPLVLTYGTLTEPPRPIAEFRLTDQTGAAFSRTNLLGQWTLLFSGFTHCPDICPLTLGIIRNAEDKLETPGHHRVVFVSVDAERDTPALLQEYLGWFDPDWVGLSGTRAALNPLLDSLELGYVRVPLGSEGDYTMDHSTAVVLIDPEARLVGYWKAPLDAERLAADLATLPAP
ncbi:SCO family protein [Marinimicrobium sp. LS-A18]|uniref:SCO family protein n=1 Tax=Marinimicrobium sp. LS-A18 TaxID=1381596 RepID=UPI000463C0A7|nr:SCO family protein [Marinimicrobium sp. LS-A18]